MNILGLRNYIYDNDFHIIIKNNYINIINFNKIIDINEKEIIVLINKKIIQINGNNLLLNKMLNNELLLTGEIESIKFKNE